MKGFKSCVKMAHGGSVRHYVEGGLSNKMGPPDNSERGGRKYGEGEATQVARAKRKAGDSLKNAAKAFRVDPELGYRGSWKNIVNKQIDLAEAVGESNRAKRETGYKKGGKVQKVMHEFKSGELHSGSKKGPVVKSRKQAIAIALSEAGKSKKG